jgi:hypothetical protein
MVKVMQVILQPVLFEKMSENAPSQPNIGSKSLEIQTQILQVPPIQTTVIVVMQHQC